MKFLGEQIRNIILVMLLLISGTNCSNRASLGSSIDALVEERYSPDGPGAVVLVAQGDRILHRKAYGLADLEMGIALAPEMIFRIGSITKQFTSVAILYLEEEGKLSLNDPLSRYIPDYPRGDEVNIEHLLTHTSGIYSFTSSPRFWSEVSKIDSPFDSLMDLFIHEPYDFNPGENFRYNNSAYVLLGYVIEKITNTTYSAFLDSVIFRPLGMSSTQYDSTQKIINNRARGYAKAGEDWTNAEHISMNHPHAAGALVSTVDDLLIWHRALISNRILSSKALQKAWSPFYLSDGRSVNYGYAWSLTDQFGFEMIEHGGAINGFICRAIYVPSVDIYVVMLTNSEMGLGGIAYKIAGLAAGKPILPLVPITLAQADLSPYIGSYMNETGDTVTIIIEEGLLYHRKGNNGDSTAFYPAGDDRFFFKNDLYPSIAFERKIDGEIIGYKQQMLGPIRIVKKFED